MEKDLGFVLRSQPYRERDRLVTLFCENQGKISGIARNAIHSRRFGGAFDLFTCIEFSYKPGVSSAMVRIDEVSIRRDFLELRNNLENTTAAGYFADLLIRMSEESQTARELFLLFAHYLFLLEKTPATFAIVRSFEIKLLDRLGYSPNLESCVACQQSLAKQTIEPAVEHGGFLCANCATATKKPIHSSTLEWLQTIRSEKIQDIPKHPFPTTACAEQTKVLQLFLRYFSPGLAQHHLHSYTLLESFLSN